MWNTLLYQPIVNALIFFYQLFNNFGLAIILLTILIRGLLIPLTLPSMKAATKMKELAPDLEKLKKRYKDKKQLAQAQMELYKKHNVNPAAGCLPQIIQLVVLIALFQAFNRVLEANGAEVITKLNEVLYPVLRLAPETIINTRFLFLDLTKPDTFQIPGVSFALPGAFLVAAALIQMLSSKMMQPSVEKAQKQAKKTVEKTDDMATAMQSQMLYLFPLMTIVIGYRFPSGLVLYWLAFSIFTAAQQYYVSGWGGLQPWLKKLKK